MQGIYAFQFQVVITDPFKFDFIGNILNRTVNADGFPLIVARDECRYRNKASAQTVRFQRQLHAGSGAFRE